MYNTTCVRIKYDILIVKTTATHTRFQINVTKKKLSHHFALANSFFFFFLVHSLQNHILKKKMRKKTVRRFVWKKKKKRATPTTSARTQSLGFYGFLFLSLTLTQHAIQSNVTYYKCAFNLMCSLRLNMHSTLLQ